MHRLTQLVVVAALLAGAGCATSVPTKSTSMEPSIRAKVAKGIIEPGFTPEMVYMALGKPSEPEQSLADATANGTWVYHDFHRAGSDIVKAGFRRRVTMDPEKKTEVITTEAIDAKTLPTLRAHSLQVTFRDGRVVEIQRAAEL